MVTMSSQEHRPAPLIDPIPSDLDSTQAKLVYLYLEATDGATIDDLGATLSMSKLSILSILNTLSSAGHVDRANGEYVISA
ncbi:hypothetical protein SAMN05421809_3292 [Natronorubrum daqingense]|uniref:MarR family transcriptional regulator n=2 Tax=Natronorubrum daqingense TaxID=588898 RepID=A0A1N7FJQ2_9EURY|nr:hypothetical protein SAMN05421809_3292 [Natronorubrum daqingense]